MALGTLKKIDLRQAWKHEANDFTRWLAEEENLAILGDEIGFDLKLIQVEAAVGKFSVDILATEPSTGLRKSSLRTSLRATDHTHLGQIITYASGYDAGVIVWVVRDVREEHRQAIDWLNNHTDDTIEFYLAKIELWQIGDSPPAPKFDIICKPNDWARTVKESTGDLSAVQLTQLEFWTQFKEFGQQRKTKLRFQKSHPQHWTDISIGSAEAHAACAINTRDNLFSVEIYIPDNKDLFARLLAKKDAIEHDLGNSTLQWMGLPEKKACRIRLNREGELAKKDCWPEYFEWLLREMEKFLSVFPKYVKEVGA